MYPVIRMYHGNNQDYQSEGSARGFRSASEGPGCLGGADSERVHHQSHIPGLTCGTILARGFPCSPVEKKEEAFVSRSRRGQPLGGWPLFVVAVAQLPEHRICNPGGTGWMPVGHPTTNSALGVVRATSRANQHAGLAAMPTQSDYRPSPQKGKAGTQLPD